MFCLKPIRVNIFLKMAIIKPLVLDQLILQIEKELLVSLVHSSRKKFRMEYISY
jgi:hypothetical protein